MADGRPAGHLTELGAFDHGDLFDCRSTAPCVCGHRRATTVTGGTVAGDKGSTDPYVIRIGTVEDAATAARLHADQITTGFLPYLGLDFLERLYRRVVRWNGGQLLVAVDTRMAAGPRGVVGFIASADPTSRLYREFLLHDGPAAAFGAVGPLLRSWRKVLETLRHGSSSSPGVGRGPEVLAMAVDPACQGKGLGGRLVLAFIDAVSASGKVEGYTVIAQGNGPSLALYRKCGFRPTEEFELHAGTPSVVMQWDLTVAGSADGDRPSTGPPPP